MAVARVVGATDQRRAAEAGPRPADERVRVARAPEGFRERPPLRGSTPWSHSSPIFVSPSVVGSPSFVRMRLGRLPPTPRQARTTAAPTWWQARVRSVRCDRRGIGDPLHGLHDKDTRLRTTVTELGQPARATAVAPLRPTRPVTRPAPMPGTATMEPPPTPQPRRPRKTSDSATSRTAR